MLFLSDCNNFVIFNIAIQEMFLACYMQSSNVLVKALETGSRFLMPLVSPAVYWF